ncbi:unnamed protein product [Durusdinium trenchii]|uniref:Uncharacterized protein n=1 Tax=Durusdinium trenchii TaxID=1381693 RepID=A0ABP0Q2B8_9DINO
MGKPCATLEIEGGFLRSFICYKLLPPSMLKRMLRAVRVGNDPDQRESQSTDMESCAADLDCRSTASHGPSHLQSSQLPLSSTVSSVRPNGRLRDRSHVESRTGPRTCGASTWLGTRRRIRISLTTNSSIQAQDCDVEKAHMPVRPGHAQIRSM